VIPLQKWRHVSHEVVERWQTQHRAVSGCGAPQWGQRQLAMA
jgi:hypothetical protein